MGRKRRIFILVWVILLMSMVTYLFVSFVQLYIQAEKAQKIRFTGEVLAAGRDMAAEINKHINSEFLKDSTMFYPSTDADGGRTLMVMKNGVPHALVNEVIADYRGQLIVLDRDTNYFHTDDSTHLVVVDTIATNYSAYTDSILLQIPPEFFSNVIKKHLRNHNLNLDFQYGVYNFPKQIFVFNPHHLMNKYLDQYYVFALRTNNSEVYTHYLILHFPSERTFFLKKMANIVVPIIIIVFLLAVLMVIMLISIGQQKHNHDAKNDFINNMTHEFKTPLSTISLACEALSDESIHNDPQTVMSFLNMIKEENVRLQKMVTNILQLAQLKKGQLKLQIEPVNIHAQLNSIVRNFSLQVSNLGGRIITRFNAPHPVIAADKSHIESIFINLIENSLKYCDKVPVIEIITSEEHGMLLVSVKDNGVGMSKKQQKHVFDEFFRVSRGNVHDNRGYGLGLHFVKQIVTLHGGRIQLESEVGKGSCFTIYLPIK
ncbi:MAG: HAMP domain-containing histidine kinase [Bacteroidales bacterium]|nr:HAMP domain-containing histidine kinase [Bacteroidales bacterium]